MKIGLYLAYAPFPKNYSLKKEGLGRYLAIMVKGFVENNHKITIACPKWSYNTILELFKEYNIDFNNLELITTQNMPLLLKLYYSLGKKKQEQSKFKIKLYKASYVFIEKIFSLLLQIRNLGSFIFLLFIGLAAILISLPFLLAAGILHLIFKIILYIPKKIFKINRIKTLSIKSIINKVYNLSIMAPIKKLLQQNFSQEKIIKKLRETESGELIKRINMMKEPTDIWYCHNSFWPEFNKIKGVTVLCMPDIVTEEFPIAFSSIKNIVNSTNDITESVENGKYFITYCNYIKETVLENKFCIDSSRIKSILMFVNETLPYINVQETYKKFVNANLFYARQILQTTPSYNSINPFYFIGERPFSMLDIKYIFYSSQVRPSKNILNLVLAYEYLLRKEIIDCKLFITGNYDHSLELKQFIEEKGLENDVICFYNVTNQQLSALYACAELVVNPTLYEGGFPFTFSEGLSVGTPSIMSNIPQVVEFTDGWGIEDCLFDPYNYRDIAEKILYGLNNRELLVEKQMPLYRMHSNRSKNGQAIEEYIQAFKYFIELEKNN